MRSRGGIPRILPDGDEGDSIDRFKPKKKISVTKQESTQNSRLRVKGSGTKQFIELQQTPSAPPEQIEVKKTERVAAEALGMPFTIPSPLPEYSPEPVIEDELPEDLPADNEIVPDSATAAPEPIPPAQAPQPQPPAAPRMRFAGPVPLGPVAPPQDLPPAPAAEEPVAPPQPARPDPLPGPVPDPQPLIPSPRPEPTPKIDEALADLYTNPPAPEASGPREITLRVPEFNVPAKLSSLSSTVPRYLAAKWRVKRGRQNIILAGSAVCLALVIGSFIWSRAGSDDGKVAGIRDDMVDSVNQVIKAPPGSQPEVLTVSDQSRVDQPFLIGSENGDKLLLYHNTQMAVLYRPSTRQIVKVGNYKPPSVRIFLRDGAGLGRFKTVTSAVNSLEGLQVYSQDQSANPNYKETIVIDLTGRFTQDAQRLASALDAKVTSLPPGENKPDGDLMVIIGFDQAQ